MSLTGASTAAAPADNGSPSGAVASGAVAAARRLRSVTFEVDARALPSLVRAGGHPGRYLWAKGEVTILGCGEALRLPLAAGWAAPAHTALVREALAAIPSEGRPGLAGCGPLAVGALPYDPARPGYLSVPELAVILRRGRAWATLTAPSPSPREAVDEQVAALAAEPPYDDLPDRFELVATMPHKGWKNLVARAVKAMEKGALSKVVLARQVEVVANRPLVVPETLARLAHLYPSCAIFHVEGFLGASPETLLRRNGTEIESHPLAGTVARSGDPTSDDALVAALMSSSKDRHEHQLVVDEIAAKLRPFALLDVPAAPSVVPLRNVSHLGTSITGVLYEGGGDRGLFAGNSHDGNPLPSGPGQPTAANGNGQARDGSQTAGHPAGLRAGLRPAPAGLPTSLDLAAVLQPTPAVGGLPVDAALEWQRQNEGFDRGRYAGPVGWVDSEGDGEWVLGLRCAQVSGPRAVLYAGNGIVAGSDPDAELGETQLKLQALLAALVRP